MIFGFDGGIGGPCLFDGQCKPPSTGLCIPETVFGQATGWPGGYCTANCTTTGCPTGSSCVNAANANGTANWLCFESCTGPRTGQSNCRSGYVCEVDLSSATGSGMCIPRCNSAGFSCWSNTTCNVTSGYCLTGP